MIQAHVKRRSINPASSSANFFHLEPGFSCPKKRARDRRIEKRPTFLQAQTSQSFAHFSTMTAGNEHDAGSSTVRDEPKHYPLHPTSPALLELCNLPENSTAQDRHRRLATLQGWAGSHPSVLRRLLASPECRDRKNGCLPLHWAAGTGFDEAIDFLLGDGQMISEPDGACVQADQKAHHPSTDRTPLHYAARNGHLATCQLLVETHGANPHPKCGRGGVTPLQLAVWQNRLDVVRYLVERNALVGNHDVIFERNGFNCGLMHWIGLVPQKRWGINLSDGDEFGSENGASCDDGTGVLPLARYLHSLGVTYESTPANSNTQGHTPMHKAAWGGNLPLIRYFRDEHGAYDSLQDQAGNYCADIAKMRGNAEVHRWLLDHGSLDRRESYRVLGLDEGASDEEVRKRYHELARRRHPDKQHRMATNDGGGDGGDEKIASDDERWDFLRIKEAYEHLTKEGGVGKQQNPKYSDVKLLEAQKNFDGDGCDGNKSNDDDLFLARLAAVLSDYGEEGFPVSLIARRWNQIWPDRPFPTPDEYIIEWKAKCRNAGGIKVVKKKTKLLKFLRWRCRGTDIQFRAVDGDMLAFDMSKMSGRRRECTSN